MDTRTGISIPCSSPASPTRLPCDPWPELGGGDPAPGCRFPAASGSATMERRRRPIPGDIPMSDYDLVIRNGTVATAADTTQCDVGIKDGVVATLGRGLAAGAREIDAGGKLVLPGAIDSHCHIEQRSSAGVMCADDFYSGTVSAAFGGTTTVIPFAAQHRGQSLRQVVEEYHEAARPQGGHRLRLPPDHLRPVGAGAGPGTAGADPGRLHLVQGLHDLRPVAPQRPPDARHPGAGAARGRDDDGACREPRHDLVAGRAAAGAGAVAAALPRGVARPDRRGRGDQPRRGAWPNCSTCRC